MGNQVYIVQDDGNRDFSKAETFGTLIPMIERDIFPDDVEERTEAVRGIIRAKLKDFRPLYDYVLLTGDPVALVITGIELQAMFGDEMIRLLKYDRENSAYYEVLV